MQFNFHYGLFSFEMKSNVIWLPFHFRIIEIQELASVAETLQPYPRFILLQELQLPFSNLKFLMKTLEWVLPIRLQVSPRALCLFRKSAIVTVIAGMNSSE